ncbi:MAG: NAD(P)-binding domain-containing protein [Gammaproteobacteria bacterium]|nr:NAD(P)-binding domain-containing protein [Gammaproteobacteria bacterium]
MQNIGYIGLGIMGKPTALNLIRAGYTLHIYARRPEIIEEFKKAGAKTYASPKELAAAVDVIFTNVPTSADVEDALLGKQGIIHSAKAGTIVIDMSTIATAATKRIAEQLEKNHIEMLDAPVSGGEKGAIEGTLSIMVGGKAEVLEKVRPLLEKLGKSITHIGGHGAGQVAKACNQIIIGETIVAVSEALHLAKASGVDPAKVREALLGGFASSKVLEVHGKRMLDNDYKPGFKAKLHRKDMHLALEQAHFANVNLPSATYATKCIDRLVLKGHSELDSAALYLVTEE